MMMRHNRYKEFAFVRMQEEPGEQASHQPNIGLIAGPHYLCQRSEKW